MKKNVFWGVFLIFFFVSVLSPMSHANSNTTTDTYDMFKLTCYIRCENTYGEGATSGVREDGYRNYIKVVTYDINQNSLGYMELYSVGGHVVRVSKDNSYLPRTYHVATRSLDNVWDNSAQLLLMHKQIPWA